METKELTPEYVLQPHAISRAAYRLSATARKIIAMGMAIIPYDLSNRIATFTFFDFCQAIGYEKGGESYRIFVDALDECVGCVITIETAEQIKKFTWVQLATIDKQTNLVTLEFSVGLTEYLIELKKMYARIELMDLGKFQSLYAIRLYEMAKSYESLAGKQGNYKDCWYFERTVEEMRTMLGVENEKYTKTNDFRRFVIENPIKELNGANLGLVLVPEYIRKGKYLVAIRFSCQKNTKKAAGSKKKSAANVPERAAEPETLAEKEAIHLTKLYPEEYAQLYAALLKNPTNALFRDIPHLWEQEAARLARRQLQERHDIRR